MSPTRAMSGLARGSARGRRCGFRTCGSPSSPAGSTAHPGEPTEEERGPFSFISWLRRSHPEKTEDKAPAHDDTAKATIDPNADRLRR